MDSWTLYTLSFTETSEEGGRHSECNLWSLFSSFSGLFVSFSPPFFFCSPLRQLEGVWLGRASAESAAWLVSGISSTNRTSPSRSPSRTTRTSPSRRCGPSPSRYPLRSAHPAITTHQLRTRVPKAPLMRPRMALGPEDLSGHGRSPATSPGKTTTPREYLSPVLRSTSRISNHGPSPGRRISRGLITRGAGQTVCRTARWILTTSRVSLGRAGGGERREARGRDGGSSRWWRRAKPAPTGLRSSLTLFQHRALFTAGVPLMCSCLLWCLIRL